MSTETTSRLESALERVSTDLLGERTPDHHWEGRLASSALAAATAISAMSLVDRALKDSGKPQEWQPLIDRGLAWLLSEQNEDGGWGDTPESISNISTTMLALAAIELAGATESNAEIVKRGNAYVETKGGIPGLRARYGRDKTFAVPILTNAALAGQVDWNQVAALPFELATLPQSFYRFARMPVVSYAIPALVAVGQTIHHHRPSKNPIVRAIRNWAVEPSRNVLNKMQPESGGFLEAIPLTSFVTMSLASIGQHEHPVTKAGLKFIKDTAREDGSWPIDTNLATWVTTLSLNALPVESLGDAEMVDCWRWLLSCQHLERHPFTGADPGGWGWSDLSGAVPDADDTPGALLALARMREYAMKRMSTDETLKDELNELSERSIEAARRGTEWLLNLQNGDGGWPTFCRGWGKLPFDRSGTDLTAHALRALLRWKEVCPAQLWQRATERGWRYLAKEQSPDGSWLPLWFGNQSYRDETNPIYGTSRVLMAYRDWDRMGDDAARKGCEFLVATQQASGGWGIAPASVLENATCSVEETAVAVEALLGMPANLASQNATNAIQRGLAWLIEAVERGEHRTSKPIGLYFAKLWYDESLYPLAFAASVLQCAADQRATT